MELKGTKIAFLGDSITEGVGCSRPDKTFWHLLAERDGVLAYGHGIRGTRIALQRVTFRKTDYDRYFASRVPELETDADLVVVFGGTNDYGHGDAPMGRPGDRTEETFCGALNLLSEKIHAACPHARIIWMTPAHRLDEANDWNEAGIRNVGMLADYAEQIRRGAERNRDLLLDIYRLCPVGTDTEEGRACLFDHLHPNDRGHEAFYGLLREFLLKL